MDDSGSIVEFFYNIVPGSLFLFSLKYFGVDFFKILGLGSDSVLIIFGYIVLGLFLGFLFQGITKIVRDREWNEEVVNRVSNKRENKKCFEESYKKVHSLRKYIIPDKFLPSFYLMDNCLRGERAAFLPTHFSSRFAFWSNILFSSICLGILAPVFYFTLPRFPPEKIWGLITLIGIIIFSKDLAYRHFEDFYDSILKSYFMIKVKE